MTIGSATSPDGRSVTEEIANDLRERISQGRLMPGQRLVEADLIQELHVSRSSIRAAFSLLASEGIITIEHNRGARVRALDAEGLRQLYEVRATLEGRAAGLAATRIDTPGSRAVIEELHAHCGDYSDRGSFSAYWNYNAQLHRQVLQLSGNDMLRKLAEQSRTLTYHYHLQAAAAQGRDPWAPPLVSIDHACDQHETVLAAILSGDAERAEQSMREHIEATGTAIVAYMRANGLG